MDSSFISLLLHDIELQLLDFVSMIKYHVSFHEVTSFRHLNKVFDFL